MFLSGLLNTLKRSVDFVMGKKLTWKLLVPVFFLIAAAAYLPLAGHFSFYYDDWYLIYSGHTQGIEKFFPVFASDRPARAYLVGWFYSLFGDNAPIYSYTGYIFRALSALGVYWIVSTLWSNKFASVGTSLLFLVYPGFLNQTNAFDYQTHLVSLALAVFSIAFSVRAVFLPWSSWKKWVLVLLAVLAELVYPLLMEYYIGLEGFRFILLLYAALRLRKQKLLSALLETLPYLLAMVLFMYWRTALFENTRSATDIDAMLEGWLGSPRQIVMIPIYILLNSLDVVLFAWAVPPYQLIYGLKLRDFAAGAAFAAAAMLLAAWLVARAGAEVKQKSPVEDSPAAQPWARDMLWLGALGMAFALIPVIMGDRSVDFGNYSRFSLPASISGVMALVGLFGMFRRQFTGGALVVCLVGLAVLTHYGNALEAVAQADDLRSFWWQTAWRAPSIKTETTIVASYPVMPIVEDYFVWGPANLVYYSQPQPVNSDPLKISAVVLNRETIQSIIGGEPQRRKRRSITTVSDFKNLLVLTRPGSTSCVHALDGSAPELSSYESDRVARIAAYSKISRVDTGAEGAVPLTEIFGSEPAHGWCYYYEKASPRAPAGRLAGSRPAWEMRPGRLAWKPTMKWNGCPFCRPMLTPASMTKWMRSFLNSNAGRSSFSRPARIFQTLPLQAGKPSLKTTNVW